MGLHSGARQKRVDGCCRACEGGNAYDFTHIEGRTESMKGTGFDFCLQRLESKRLVDVDVEEILLWAAAVIWQKAAVAVKI